MFCVKESDCCSSRRSTLALAWVLRARGFYCFMSVWHIIFGRPNCAPSCQPLDGRTWWSWPTAIVLTDNKRRFLCVKRDGFHTRLMISSITYWLNNKPKQENDEKKSAQDFVRIRFAMAFKVKQIFVKRNVHYLEFYRNWPISNCARLVTWLRNEIRCWNVLTHFSVLSKQTLAPHQLRCMQFNTVHAWTYRKIK